MKTSLYFLLISVAITSFGQSAKTDSLEQLVRKESDLRKKLVLLNDLSFWYFDVDVAKADASTQQALEIASKIGDKKGLGWAHAYRGVYFFLSGILPSANIEFNQSIAIGKSIGENNLQTYSLTQLGNSFRDKGVYDSARLFYKRAWVASLSNQDHKYQAVLKKNLVRYYLIRSQPDSAMVEAQNALQLTEQLHDPVLMADVWMLLGNCYRAADNFVEAERYYRMTETVTRYDAVIKVDYLQNIGEIFFRRGDFQQSIKSWQLALNSSREYQYKYGLAELLYRMGNVFEEQGYYDLGTEYLAQALDIAEKASYQYLIGKIAHEQCWIYYRTRNFELAFASYQRATNMFKVVHADLELAATWDLRGLIERNLGHYDSSLYYHTISLEGRNKFNNKVEVSASYFNIGEYYLTRKDYNQALGYYFKSLKIDLSIGDNYGISLNYNRLGRIYTLLSIYDSAKLYLDKALLLAIPVSSNELFHDNYLDMSYYYERIGKPSEAIKYYKLYNQFTDSLFNTQTAQSLASYRALYDVERNTQKIELLSKDNELNKARVQRQQIILYAIGGGSLILLVLAGSYYQFYRSLKKLNFSLAERSELVHAQSEELQLSNETLSNLNKEISEQKEKIQTQAEELAESNQTISQVNEKLEQRIEERTAELKQAFKELDTFFYRASHDFRRPLTTFMGLAEVARVLLKDPAALELFEKVDENAQNLDKMLRKLQSISDIGAQELIYREVFLKEIFEIELDNLQPELEKRKISTSLNVKLDQPFYSYGALIKIIVQNLLENAIAFNTHANPEIQLQAYENSGEIILEVKDNGLGIETKYLDRVFEMYYRANEHSKGNGLGLYIVKKTVQKLNGRIQLESILGVGTSVKIFLPHRLERY